MNPLLFLLPIAAFLFMGKSKASASAPSTPKPIRIDEPTVSVVPHQEEGDTEHDDAPMNVNLGPAVIQPAPAPTPQPMTVTKADGSPVSKSDADARAKAQSVADHVKAKQYNYDRKLLAAWQALAGLVNAQGKPDGLYGPKTVARLQALGAKNVNKALFKG